MNLIVPFLYHSAYRGYAGIGRQLHPLKAKDLLEDNVIEIERKNDIWVLVYQSITIELANSTIQLLCQSVHQESAGISRQLHPLKDLKMDRLKSNRK